MNSTELVEVHRKDAYRRALDRGTRYGRSEGLRLAARFIRENPCIRGPILADRLDAIAEGKR